MRFRACHTVEPAELSSSGVTKTVAISLASWAFGFSLVARAHIIWLKKTNDASHRSTRRSRERQQEGDTTDDRKD